MEKMTPSEETVPTSLSSKKHFGNVAAISVFSFIGIVYLFTLVTLYPNMPITTRNAEDIPTFMEIYPPFRMDEVNYYTMAQNIINGNPYEDGSIEMNFSIGFSIAAVPFIVIWDKLGGYIANVVIVWFSLLIFFLIARRYVSLLKSLLMTLLLAFATLNWFYAVSCYSEPLSQLLILLGFYFLTWDKTSKKLNLALFAAGALLGLNIFIRPYSILIVIPFFLLSWIEHNKKFTFNNRAFWFAGGITLICILWLIRNQIFFGDPLSFEYTRMVGRMTGDASIKHYSGNFFWGIHQLLFDQFHGLFTITPILLLFPAGLHKMWHHKMKQESLMLLCAALIIVIFVAFSPYPFTEFGLGSRHMVPILPLLFLPLIFFIDGTLFTNIIITLLALYSFYHSGLGWFTGTADYIGERGIFVGLLHQRTSQAIILARKNILPKREFTSEQELIDTFYEARKKCDMMKFFQTLHPEVIVNIRGNEQAFTNFIRTHPNVKSLIISVDTEKGILLKKITFR